MEEGSDAEREGWRGGGWGRGLGVGEERAGDGERYEKRLCGDGRERGYERDGSRDGNFGFEAERLGDAGRANFAAVVGAVGERAFAGAGAFAGLGADEGCAIAAEGVHGKGQSGSGDEEGAARHPIR